MPEYRRRQARTEGSKDEWKATASESENFQRPSKERDRATTTAVTDKVAKMHYAGQSWPKNPKEYGKPITKGDKRAFTSASKRLSQSGDVTYGYRSDTGKTDPYDPKKFNLKKKK